MRSDFHGCRFRTPTLEVWLPAPAYYGTWTLEDSDGLQRTPKLMRGAEGIHRHLITLFT
jgi:hypothetical protein